MANYKCKMCGGELELIEDSNVCECAYCGTRQTVPTADDEKKMKLFERAGKLLRSCEFDKAAGVFESIVADFSEEAEAYWGLILCKYGIEYVDDPATGKKVPTCHRSSFDSVMDDENFELVMENADPVARKVYREEAKTMEELRKGIIEVSGKEEPYDIFICYKETDENGERTLDSVLAQDVYEALTEKGYRVFFSRISLEDKLGVEYEPYIFAALHSAKIMLAFGTDYEYYNAVWVKNEWSRFLQLMTTDKEKHLIPCYKNIDAYDIPKEFAKLQAQDLGKVGAVQDLLRGIEKLLGSKEDAGKTEAVVVKTEAPGIASLLKRGQLFLEDKDWKNADEYFDRVLDIDPEYSEAYVGKLCAELRVKNEKELENLQTSFDQNGNYQKAVRFASDSRKEELTNYVLAIIERNLQRVLKAAEKETDLLNKRNQQGDQNDLYENYMRAAKNIEKLGDYDVLKEQAKVLREKAQEVLDIYKHSAEDLEEKMKLLQGDLQRVRNEFDQKLNEQKQKYQKLRDTSESLSVFKRQEKRQLEREEEEIQGEIDRLEQEKEEAEEAIKGKIEKAHDQILTINRKIIKKKDAKEVVIKKADRLKEEFCCPACGALNRSDRLFCFNCGIKFLDEE